MVAVRDEEGAARAQHAYPLGDRRLGVGHVPEDVAAHDDVERLVGETQAIGGGLREENFAAGRLSVHLGGLKHFDRDVHGRHVGSRFGGEDREEASARTDVEHPTARERVRVRKVAGPAVGFGSVDVVAGEKTVTRGAAVPVVGDPFKERGFGRGAWRVRSH